MNGSYEMTPEQRAEWEADRGDSDVGEEIDFETTLPSAVEELMRQRDERQRA